MEVMIVSAIDPSTIRPGGTRSYVLNLIHFLMEQGIKVTLIGASYNNKHVQSKYPFNFIPVIRNPKISSYRYLLSLFLHVPFLQISEDCIIHAQRPDVLIPFVIFHRKNKKICTMHGNSNRAIYSEQGYLVGKINSILEKYILKQTNVIILVDDNTREFYTNKFEWLKEKSTVIPIGIDTKLFRPMDKQIVRKKYGFGENDKVILYVGRLGKDKGLDLLIASAKLVFEKVPNSKLVLVGGGTEKQHLQNITGIMEEVVFIDLLPHENIPEIINCSDVFALCSLYEGMPTVVLEALACGVPVVSTDVGDVHKVVIDGETGYIVKTRTEKEISTRLINVLLNSDIYKENCIRTAKDYSWEKIAEKIIGVYDNCIHA